MISTKERPIKKVTTIINNILILAVAGSCVFTVFLTIRASGNYNPTGYGLRIVMSSSMEKNPQVDVSEYRIKDIPAKSLILIQLVPRGREAAQKWYSELEKGDVLTFVYKIVGGSTTITHRVKDIEKTNDGYKITLAGDNVGDEISTQIINTDDLSSGNRVIGKVIYKSYFLGFMVCALRDPNFVVALMMLILISSLSRAYVANMEKKRHRFAPLISTE